MVLSVLLTSCRLLNCTMHVHSTYSFNTKQAIDLIGQPAKPIFYLGHGSEADIFP